MIACAAGGSQGKRTGVGGLFQFAFGGREEDRGGTAGECLAGFEFLSFISAKIEGESRWEGGGVHKENAALACQ